MTLNTRGKRREPIPAPVELILNQSTARTIKLNVHQDSMVGDEVIIKTSLIDISVSGCSIDSPYLIPPGIVFDIKVSMAPFVAGTAKGQEGAMKMTCRITSCTMKATGHYRLGAKFTKIIKEDQDIIDAFIKANDQRKDQRWNISK